MKGHDFRTRLNILKEDVIGTLLDFLSTETDEIFTKCQFFISPDGDDYPDSTVAVGITLETSGVFPLGAMKVMVAPRTDHGDIRLMDTYDVDVDTLIAMLMDIEAQEAGHQLEKVLDKSIG